MPLPRPGGSLTPPVVDRLSVRVVMDTTHDIFISGDPHPMVAIERTRTIVSPKRITLGGQWGLSLHLESMRGAETRGYLLDFGYTPDGLTRNIELLNSHPAPLDVPLLTHR